MLAIARFSTPLAEVTQFEADLATALEAFFGLCRFCER
jgi:hypothetical protein